ncbi:tubulin polymerization-promoting protein family member hypothetical protein [Limosa lapponica baueri]|uniref:Uncharacterized protein n=1 Tax=Limosa lapponica baueri TaxID=1758121 RepID=A0A2I0U8R3_LIMLA|nr:tubulin polymerization-promoting protein family member hypothetical protein [Limosa lapponica baueri]
MSKVEKAFCKFVIFGDTPASGNDMTGKNFSKMYKECGVMDGKAVTSTDVDIVFNKVKGVSQESMVGNSAGQDEGTAGGQQALVQEAVLEVSHPTATQW